MLGIFLDIETNGLNFFKHRSLEIAFKIVNLYDGIVLDHLNEVILQPLEIWEKSDLKSLKVNGFTWEMVLKGKPEKEVADQILISFQKHSIKRFDAVFICQNPSFDRIFFAQMIDPDQQEMLKWPYHWLDLASMYWGSIMENAMKQNLSFPWEKGLSKDSIAHDLKISEEKKPHRAINGVDHLILCYKNVIGFPFAQG